MRSPVPCCYYRGFCAELYAPPHVPLLQFTQILICPPCCRSAVLTGGMHSNPSVSPVFSGMWSSSIDYNLNLSSAAILISVVIKECVPLIILKVFFRILQPFALFLCFFFGPDMMATLQVFRGECYFWHSDWLENVICETDWPKLLGWFAAWNPLFCVCTSFTQHRWSPFLCVRGQSNECLTDHMIPTDCFLDLDGTVEKLLLWVYYQPVAIVMKECCCEGV